MKILSLEKLFIALCEFIGKRSIIEISRKFGAQCLISNCEISCEIFKHFFRDSIRIF